MSVREVCAARTMAPTMILRRVSRLRSDFVSSVWSRRNRSARSLSASLVLAASSRRRSFSFTI